MCIGENVNRSQTSSNLRPTWLFFRRLWQGQSNAHLRSYRSCFAKVRLGQELSKACYEWRLGSARRRLLRTISDCWLPGPTVTCPKAQLCPRSWRFISTLCSSMLIFRDSPILPLELAFCLASRLPKTSIHHSRRRISLNSGDAGI